MSLALMGNDQSEKGVFIRRRYDPKYYKEEKFAIGYSVASPARYIAFHS